MKELISRVKNIQNKARSLKWGSCMYDERSIVFAVGHDIYHKTVYIKVRVTDAVTYAVDHLKDDGQEVCIEDHCIDYDGVILQINKILAKEFPARGGIR